MNDFDFDIMITDIQTTLKVINQILVHGLDYKV